VHSRKRISALILRIPRLEANPPYLNNTHGDSLTHIADREAAQRWELLEGLDAHRLGRLQHHDGGVATLDALWILFGGLARAAIALLFDLGEFAGDMGSVAVEHRRVTVADLSRVIQHDHLGSEVGGAARRLVLGVASHIATPQLLHGDVLHVKADVVTRQGLRECLVVHLD